MAGRYPDYDWRGIAMLTQQLGQLFEPSKAKMMSQQQDHEMNMLMAKQAWDMQSDQLDVLKAEYKKLTADLEIQTEAVNILGGKDLVNAGMSDGSNVGETSAIYDKLDVKKLSDMQEVAAKYREMIRDKKTVLSNMKTYNEYGKIGKKFGTDYKGEKGAKNYLEIHDIEPETPGFLSPDERENVKFDALNTMFLVENVENLKEGTDYMTIYAAGQPVNVRPEALAFVAGFDTDSAEARLEKTVKAKALYVKPEVKNEEMINQYLNLDATFMNLSLSDQALIGGALTENSSIGLPPGLKDTFKAMQKRDELSVKLGAAGYDESVQPLPDVMFESERDPTWYLPESKEPRIQKPWTQYEENGKINPGLTKKMYDDIRGMGEKGGMVRRDFQHIVNNWDNLTPGQRISGIQLVYRQYSKIKADELKEIQGL